MGGVDRERREEEREEGEKQSEQLIISGAVTQEPPGCGTRL